MKLKLIKEENIKVGSHIHAGLAVKGGAGYHGVVTKVEGETVHLRSHEKGKFGHRTWKASKKNVTVLKEEAPTTNAGGGHIAGLSSVSEPGRKMKKKKGDVVMLGDVLRRKPITKR